jgi:hypothetical protein
MGSGLMRVAFRSRVEVDVDTIGDGVCGSGGI